MIHIQYNDRGNIAWISPDVKFEYNRGNVSRDLWVSIENYLNINKKDK